MTMKKEILSMTESLELIFCGDIHGELRKLVWSLVYSKKLSNINVICLGDFGMGFGKPRYFDLLYQKISNRLEKNNITIYALRGNHDDPTYFDGNHDYPRLKFIKDYEVFELSGLRILPIGGASSVDRNWRVKFNEKMKNLGSSKRSWWKEERPIQVSTKQLPNKVDIIISHEAPLSFEPVIVRESGLDEDIYNNILEDRHYLDSILKEVVAKYWFHGHYHRSTSGSYGDLLYRGLNINELYCLYV